MNGIEALRGHLAQVADPLTLLEGIFEHAPVGFQIYAPDGRSLLTNRAFRDLFGSEPPPEYRIFDDEVVAAAGLAGAVRRAFAGETVHVPPFWYDPRALAHVSVPDGRRVAISPTSFPLYDRDHRVAYVAVVLKDVTAEMEAREQVEAERDLLRAIIEQSGDGIIVADSDSVIQIFNPEAERQHGMSGRAVAAPDWTATYGIATLEGRPMPLADAPLYRALQGETVQQARWQVRRPDGTERVLAGTASPLRRGDGSLAGAILITRDETERLRLEEDLRHAATFRERFLGIVGHDLRSPLSVITASTKLLLTRMEPTPDQASILERVAASAERMERMIADLLDFTRSRLGGGFPVSRRPLDMHRVCRDLVEGLAAANPGCELRFRAEGGGGGAWDPDRVAQVVTNLLDNALRYGLPERPIDVTTAGAEDAVVLSLHNWGPPIPEEVIPGLFDPFRRAASQQARVGLASRSLGLGLYIAREIVEAHGGTIKVHSTAEEGTTFTVRWPRGAAADPGRGQ